MFYLQWQDHILKDEVGDEEDVLEKADDDDVL
jgi:hypothetical protein